MEEEIDETVNSLDEKDDEESKEQKDVPSFLPKDECHDNCYDPVDLFEISLFDVLDA